MDCIEFRRLILADPRVRTPEQVAHLAGCAECASLARLGLKLPSKGVNVRYLGKCPVPSGTGEHVVLETALGRLTLILVPDQPFGPRVLVADREMTALTVPVRTGGYILVADSVEHVRRIERALM